MEKYVLLLSVFSSNIQKHLQATRIGTNCCTHQSQSTGEEMCAQQIIEDARTCSRVSKRRTHAQQQAAGMAPGEKAGSRSLKEDQIAQTTLQAFPRES
jgi:hypothetical protein